MWSAECERDGPSVSMIAWSDSDSVAFGISSRWHAKFCMPGRRIDEMLIYLPFPCRDDVQVMKIFRKLEC